MPLPPRDFGADALRYMQEIGIPAIVPNGRSSDADDANSDPFGYLMKRRFGLQPAVTHSKALNAGKWLHHHFQNYWNPPDTYAALTNQALIKEQAEVGDRAAKAGMGHESITRLEQDEHDTCVVTSAWFDAAVDVHIADYSTLREFIMDDRWDLISCEDKYDLRLSGDGDPWWLTVQPDRMLYDKHTNKVYILDLKSCGGPTEIRSATCPFEFQTWHYIYTIAELMARGAFTQWYGLPADATMGGMYHPLMQKPTIIFGTADRPYRWVAHAKLKRRMGRAFLDGMMWKVEVWPDDQGPYNAIVSTFPTEQEACVHLSESVGVKCKKQADDDPDIHIYADRCRRWYSSEGEFAARAFEADTPVEISFTDGNLMTDPEIRREYYDSLTRIRRWATMPAHPCDFWKNYSKLRDWNALSPYAGFYTNPVDDWPEVIARGHFIVNYRDPPGSPLDPHLEYQMRKDT